MTNMSRTATPSSELQRRPDGHRHSASHTALGSDRAETNDSDTNDPTTTMQPTTAMAAATGTRAMVTATATIDARRPSGDDDKMKTAPTNKYRQQRTPATGSNKMISKQAAAANNSIENWRRRRRRAAEQVHNRGASATVPDAYHDQQAMSSWKLAEQRRQ